jgi:hypothetical protein
MYEFLAPWGALIPLVSGVVSYLLVSESRRKQMMKDIEAPPNADMRPFSSMRRPLSVMHG